MTKAANNAREQICKTAEQLLTDEMGLLEGVRRIVSLLPASDLVHDEVFVAIIGVESETDHFPESFDTWERGAATRLVEERDRYLAGQRDVLMAACREIVGKFGK